MSNMIASVKNVRVVGITFLTLSYLQSLPEVCRWQVRFWIPRMALDKCHVSNIHKIRLYGVLPTTLTFLTDAIIFDTIFA